MCPGAGNVVELPGDGVRNKIKGEPLCICTGRKNVMRRKITLLRPVRLRNFALVMLCGLALWCYVAWVLVIRLI